MAIKYSDEEKKAWKKAAEEQKQKMQDMLKDLADTWQENPETIVGMLEFGSRIYKYSLRNSMLIYSQNPHATYVQSFNAWNEMGAAVKKGEKGYKVYVPVNATVLKIDGHLVPLEQATKEQKLQYKAGEIESITTRHFKIGTVFDISQTTYPKENYPKLFNMGYGSALHLSIVKGLVSYAKSTLQCPVHIVDMKSISLRGDYDPENNRIRINELLEDTEKLSTLSHELGHALVHNDMPVQKSLAQIELEADALSIMFASRFGIEITESRKRHLASHYKRFQNEYAKAPEDQKPDNFGQVVSNVFQTFRRELPVMNEYIEKQLQKDEQTLIKQGIYINESMKKYPETPGTAGLEKEDIYDRIKQGVSILDYAGMHGIELQRVGRYYTIKGHDSVRIDPDKNCFWRNSGIGQTTTGSVIDFANAFVHDDDLHESLKELTGLVSGNAVSIKSAAMSRMQGEQRENRVQRPLSENLPERAKNMHRAYAYLTQTRFIEPEVVQDLVDRKVLYQDIKGNCVFVSHDNRGKPVFASLRGTLSDKKFLGDISGSDYKQGFYISNDSDKLIVTESVIDAMSVMSILKEQGMDYKQYDYLPLNSADKHEALLAHLAAEPKVQVLLALDHDLAGVKNMQILKERIMDGISDMRMHPDVTFHVPQKKDWNEELLDAMRHLRPASEINFLSAGELPQIHYCAVQSTKEIEESGFRKRQGHDQYRLVELNDQKQIVPVDIKRNIIFKTADEVRQHIPDMYEEISYERLSSMQQQQMAGLERPLTKSSPALEFQKEHGIVIKGFEVSDGIMVAADVIYGNVESREGIYRQDGRYYSSIGYAFDNSYVEFDLTEEQKDELEAFILKHGLMLDKNSQLLMLEETAGQIKEEVPETTGGGTDFLNVLQQQMFQEEEIRPEPELAMGMGE